MTLLVDDTFRHGLRCMDCDQTLPQGVAYSKRLVAMHEDTPIVELVCVPCAIGLAP